MATRWGSVECGVYLNILSYLRYSSYETSDVLLHCVDLFSFELITPSKLGVEDTGFGSPKSMDDLMNDAVIERDAVVDHSEFKCLPIQQRRRECYLTAISPASAILYYTRTQHSVCYATKCLDLIVGGACTKDIGGLIGPPT